MNQMLTVEKINFFNKTEIIHKYIVITKHTYINHSYKVLANVAYLVTKLTAYLLAM